MVIVCDFSTLHSFKSLGVLLIGLHIIIIIIIIRRERIAAVIIMIIRSRADWGKTNGTKSQWETDVSVFVDGF